MTDDRNRSIDRRQMLAGMACGAAAAAAAPKLPAADKAPAARWKMKLATSSIQYSKLPIEQACERIAALGFEGIDIWSGHAGCPHLDDVQKRLGADGLKKLLAKTKLTLYSFSVYRGGYRRYAKLLGEAGPRPNSPRSTTRTWPSRTTAGRC